jgi:hypothetical protein
VNQQALTYIVITCLLIVLAVFGYELVQESDIKQALSTKCCSKKQLESFKLKLETTACYGRCPVFSLEISNDRGLHVVGKQFVNFKELEKTLSEEDLIAIGKLIYQSNYFGTKNIYGYKGKGCKSNATDNPSSLWNINIGEDTGSIEFYKGCFGAPKELALLEQELIRRLGLESALL